MDDFKKVFAAHGEFVMRHMEEQKDLAERFLKAIGAEITYEETTDSRGNRYSVPVLIPVSKMVVVIPE
jgi:hypothetical protein